MSIVKSYAVGNGDMFYVQHNSDNFTIIDCDLSAENADAIIQDLKAAAAGRGIERFISTHPDEDHFGGIHLLDDLMPISNFYVVRNRAAKAEITPSFTRYRQLRDGAKAFYIEKGCRRKWMNEGDETRGQSGIDILWPDVANEYFLQALGEAEAGNSPNNISAVVRYAIEGGASFMWLGDLHTEFMENIADSIELAKTTVVFAAHHGRDSGRIPHSWLRRLDPQIIVIGEAPSRHLNYYTNYRTITQNRAGHITMDCVGDKVHIYTSNAYDRPDWMAYEWMPGAGYVGSITVETEYTLENMGVG